MVEINAMNISIPPDGYTAQDWGRILSTNFSVLDYHNHALNYGIPVESSDLGQTALNLNNFSILNTSFLTFMPSPGGSESAYSLFVSSGGDLVYENSTYTLPLTSGSGLNLAIVAVGFTLTSAAPFAFFDPNQEGVVFQSSVGANTSTIVVDTLNASHLHTENQNITNLPTNPNLQANETKNSFLVANVTLPTYATQPYSASYNAWETGTYIYKLSENGVFYYDNLPYDSASSYDLSYFRGSKSWISSPNTEKADKSGTQYYMQTLNFPVTNFFMNQTLILNSNLQPGQLVSFIPKIQTGTYDSIGNVNGLLKNLPLPTFKVLFSGNTLSVAVYLNYKSYAANFISMQLQFKLIYTNPNYTIVN